MTICPCCGFKSVYILNRTVGDACSGCGARAVGEPLPRPEHELPSYGRSLVLTVAGALMVLVFFVETIIALAQRVPFSFSFWSWVAAAETASWRLKWVAIPATLFVLFGSRKLYRSIVRLPSDFCGLRYARRGYAASLAVPLLILVMIGVTVPERLRHRQWGIEAGQYALGYTFDRAFFQYREKFGKMPNDLSDLRQVPDPDGSIAAALNSLDPLAYTNAYRPWADVAALPKQKPRTLRGAVIRNASLNTATDDSLSDSLGEGLSFTNYDLRLPGPDNLMGTEDDLLVRDGVITNASETLRRVSSTTSATQKRQP
ncbi:MAG TPA: hypothetical protein DCK93_13820 [Blastocatellia bacterium]|nr:hypothetical protein [Blastocatellia bacterium]